MKKIQFTKKMAGRLVIFITLAFSSLGRLTSLASDPQPSDSGTNAPTPASAPTADENTPTIDVIGVAKPLQTNIHWTAYYITPAKMADPGKGRVVTYTNLAGKTTKLRVTNECYRQSEIEAAAVGVDKDGVEHFAYRVSPGVWKELPKGCAGMGNKLNALVPLDHVAAEQKKYPFGSMIYCPEIVGIKLGDGEPMDGYFWVSDVGSAVTGNHFDLFVGSDATYKDFTSKETKPTYPTVIYKLPAAPKGMDPRTDEGLAAILRKQGVLTEEVTSADKYKILDALLVFQQANPHIPVAEYGNPKAATTLWFLIQAALAPAPSK
jgi:3D (Asp-Asp-Asp) domain-containing protein